MKAQTLKDNFHIFAIMLICIIGFLIYGCILKAPFHYDDHVLIVNNHALKDITDISRIWNARYPKTKFLTSWTFALNYYLGGNNPFGYHLLNVLLHICSVILFYLCMLNLCSLPRLKDTIFLESRNAFALLTALIFLTHPLQTQSVTYVWSRSEILSGIFSLLSLHLYLLGRRGGRKGYFAGAFLVFLSGVFARGNIIIIMPFLIIVIEALFYENFLKRTKKMISKSWPVVLGILAVLILLIILLKHFSSHLGVIWILSTPVVSRTQYLFTQFFIICKYMQLLILPINQKIDYHIPLAASFFEMRTMASFGFIAAIFMISVLIHKKNRLMSLGILWFFICLLPVSSILTLSIPMSESRLYLPLAGFAIFLTAILFRIFQTIKFRNIAAVGIFIILGLLTVARNSLWLSPKVILKDALKDSPTNIRPLLGLGDLYYREGQLQEALYYYQMAINIEPSIPEAINNIGLIYKHYGNYDEAEIMFNKALGLRPHSPSASLNLASIWIMRKDYQKAEEYIKMSGDAQETEMGHLLYGNIYMAQNDFKLAFRLNPDSSAAYFQLGKIYYKEDDLSSSVKYFQKAIEILPDFIEAHINLGKIYFIMKDLEKSRISLERVLEIDPRRMEIYQYLADIYRSLRDY